MQGDDMLAFKVGDLIAGLFDFLQRVAEDVEGPAVGGFCTSTKEKTDRLRAVHDLADDVLDGLRGCNNHGHHLDGPLRDPEQQLWNDGIRDDVLRLCLKPGFETDSRPMYFPVLTAERAEPMSILPTVVLGAELCPADIVDVPGSSGLLGRGYRL